jgi:hypothetical protein
MTENKKQVAIPVSEIPKYLNTKCTENRKGYNTKEIVSKKEARKT